MIAALANAIIKYRTIVINDIYLQMELKYAIVAATKAEVRIKVAVLFTAASFCIPNFNHTGIKTNAPPIAKVAPTNPAQKPAAKKYHTLS